VRVASEQRSSSTTLESAERDAWLFTVSRNLYRSHRRWSLLDVKRLRRIGPLQEAAPASPFEALAASTTERALEQALVRLPLDQREMVLLCSVSGFEPSRNLPAHDVDPALADRLRRRAHALVLERAKTLQQASGWAGYDHSMIEPTALLALGLGYLISSFQATMALFL
jgi:hypothetical protein